MTMPRSPISPGQIKAIHSAIHALGWDDDLYREVLRQQYKVTTCKELSHIQAGLLLDELAQKKTPSPQPSPAPGRGGAPKRHAWPAPARKANPGKAISPKQQEYIGKLFEKLGWEPARCAGLCKKVLGGRAWPQDNADVDRLLRVLIPLTKRYPQGGYDRARGG